METELELMLCTPLRTVASLYLPLLTPGKTSRPLQISPSISNAVTPSKLICFLKFLPHTTFALVTYCRCLSSLPPSIAPGQEGSPKLPSGATWPLNPQTIPYHTKAQFIILLLILIMIHRFI